MALTESPVTVSQLQQMKRDGRKIVGVVVWDCQIAQIVDRAGVEIVSVGDSVGVNLWGRTDPNDVTIEEMALVCRAVRKGVKRALVSCDFPYGPLQRGHEAALQAALLLKEAGADMVKLDGAVDFPDAVRAIVHAGIPVFAQFDGSQAAAQPVSTFVEQAKRLEDAGAALLDFKHSGPEAGTAVVGAVAIPVLGGQGGGPWLDGRMRMAHAAIGYAANTLDSQTESYAHVAQITLEAITAYASDVRAGRHLKGQRHA
jgi:3-methyl-2-oxobutanoate hydroxymethyltransferase